MSILNPTHTDLSGVRIRVVGNVDQGLPDCGSPRAFSVVDVGREKTRTLAILHPPR